MNKEFDKIIDRSKNEERKWSQEYLEHNFSVNENNKLYNLTIADFDFETPKSIVEAIVQRANKKTYSYTYTQEETLNVIKIWYKKIHNIEVLNERIKLVHGTVNAMFQTVQCFTNPGDAVLINTPIYQPFERSIIKTGRRPVFNELIYNNNKYNIDFELFEEQVIKYNIKLYLFCNPHNPGGRIWTKNEIDKIIAICKKHDVLILSDEVHGDLFLKNKHNSILEFTNKTSNFIMCNSPNKVFNLGGLKSSYMIVGNDMLFEKIHNQYESQSITTSNIFFQPALISAYTDPANEKWLAEFKDYISNNFSLLTQYLSDLKNINIMDMDASYLVWVKLNTNKKSNELKELFESNNILLSFSDDFAGCKDVWIRINIGLPEITLKAFLKKFKNIIKEI